MNIDLQGEDFTELKSSFIEITDGLLSCGYERLRQAGEAQ